MRNMFGHWDGVFQVAVFWIAMIARIKINSMPTVRQL